MCAEDGLTFIGPSPEAIEAMGDKITAVQLAEQAGVPRVPGSGRIEDAADAPRVRPASRLSGPDQGQCRRRRARHAHRAREADIAREIDAAAAEAKAAFGDATLYMEKFIERARHIEIQVMADSHGNVVHLGERDCSTQRRHQKLIEEAPSPASTQGCARSWRRPPYAWPSA